MKELIPQYQEELDTLKQKMLDSQDFALRFSDNKVLHDTIIKYKLNEKYTGSVNVSYSSVADLYHGVCRWYMKAGSKIFNSSVIVKDNTYLWRIKISQYDLFGEDCVNTGLSSIKDESCVFHYDALNDYFYVTDNDVVELFKLLEDWYAKAKDVNNKARKDKQRKDLEDRLARLDEQESNI